MAALSHRGWRTKFAGHMEESETSSKMERYFHNVEELEVLVKEKKSTWVKICIRAQKRETEVYATSEGMAEDAKVDDGIKTRIKKGFKQLRKAREEERAAKEL